MTTADNRMLATVFRADDGQGVIRVEDVYDTDIDDLWSALTDPGRLSRWIATVEGELQVGGRFAASFTSSWEGPGRVDACQQPTRLEVTLNPDEPDATTIVAVLSAEGDKTRLVIEERGHPVDDLPWYGAGWQAHVEDLAAHVAGQVPGDWRSRWNELVPVYVSHFDRRM